MGNCIPLETSTGNLRLGVIEISLLEDAFEECVILDKTTQKDGYGGVVTTYVDGASIQAAIVFDSSLAARTASVQGVKDLYTVTTRRNVVLQFHDVIRRQKDGKVLRITTDGKDKETPQGAGLDMRVVNAEEFTITNNG